METSKVTNRTQDAAEKEFDKLFDELVPTTGKTPTKAGEIVRAVARLGYRWYNDGDMLGVGYGKQTCNPAGRFLCDKLPEIAPSIWDIWGIYNETQYERGLLEVKNRVIDHILANPQLRTEPNADDFFDWRDPYEDVDDSDDDSDEFDEVW